MKVVTISKSLTKAPVVTRPSSNRLAKYVLGLGFLLGAGTLNAALPQDTVCSKERTEIGANKSAEKSGDKTLIGEGLFGLGILTAMGISLKKAKKES